MKTKRQYMIAKFDGARADNAENMSRDKETVSYYKVIDKKTERVIVNCAVYMGRSAKAHSVYASLWVHGIQSKPDAWEYGETSGKGAASGYGYHKESAAIGSAIASAGIRLYGNPYNGRNFGCGADKKGFSLKNPVHINGCGSSAVEDALCAIAYAAGCKDAIFVSI